MSLERPLDPFRPAENDTTCPNCGNDFGWNDEDGLAGQSCGCGYVFTEADDEEQCTACGGTCKTNARGLCEGCEDDTADAESSIGPEDEPDPAPESD